MAFATSSDNSVASISKPVYKPGKQNYKLTFIKPGKATINIVSASGLKASFNVVVKNGDEGFTCDTNSAIKVKPNTTYTFEITSNKKPSVVLAYGPFDIISTKQVGNKYYYTMYAYDNTNWGPVGVYINGLHTPTFTVEASK